MIVIFIHAGSGVPNGLQSQQNGITLMSDSDIPQTSNVLAMYTSQGGQLTEFGMFGEDPLSSQPDLVSRRDHYFFSTHPSFDDLFSDVVRNWKSFFLRCIGFHLCYKFLKSFGLKV